MPHIGTTDEVWAWGGSPENAIQRMPGPEKKKVHKNQNKILSISVLRSDLLKLDAQLKKFGRTKCKFHKNRKGKPEQGLECCHPAMAYGGMNRNTNCELENCPRILYGDVD